MAKYGKPCTSKVKSSMTKKPKKSKGYKK